MCNEIFNFSRLGSYMPYHLMITALKDENPEIFFFFGQNLMPTFI